MTDQKSPAREAGLAVFGLASESLKFDPARVRVETEQHGQLAAIIAVETERTRAEVGPALDTCYWDELLMQPKCAARCAASAGMPATAVVAFAIENCVPRNPLALYWFGQCLELKDELARMPTVILQSRKFGPGSMGKKAMANRWKHTALMKKFVQDRWEMSGRTGYSGNKSQFARSIANEVKIRFEVENDILPTTIAKWLKGR